jgi:hypothetical protein
MAQLSRPFQIALLAFGLLVAVWFVALRGHSSSTSGSGSAPAASAPASTPSASAQAEKAAAPSPVDKGSAPGVSGLARAIAKAHGAVTSSQQSAKQVEQESAQASTATTPAASGSSTASPAGSSATSKASPTTTAPTVQTHGASAPGAASKSTLQSQQRAVEAELKQGKIVVLLFWNPKGADDVAVHKTLQALARRDRARTAVHEASASQVASFGSITRGVQVYGTPTIMIVNKRGQASTMTGLEDSFAIEQAIAEARHS